MEPKKECFEDESNHEDTTSEEESMSEDETPTTSDEEFIVSDEEGQDSTSGSYVQTNKMLWHLFTESSCTPCYCIGSLVCIL